ncbi:hypothetical protein ACEWY4_006038 [Coilia grayii]|uniref:Myb/SANT-like DNA-binding domain-containing protein n=1 Tax=Coilia grayii TaxID=363190 RepID=A0ABD1KCQ2_9TELE
MATCSVAMETVVSGPTTPPAYRWTDEDTRRLILWRSRNSQLFTGRRNASTDAYSVFLAERGIKGVEAKALKKRWENLVAKYKEHKQPPSGMSTEGGGDTAASWKWYSLMDEAIGARRSITPPVLFASATKKVAVSSPPPVEEDTADSPSTSPIRSTPKRQRVDRMGDILQAIKEQDRQQEEVLAQIEREQRTREASEEARAREAAAREERLIKTMMERDERLLREMEAIRWTGRTGYTLR